MRMRNLFRGVGVGLGLLILVACGAPDVEGSTLDGESKSGCKSGASKSCSCAQGGKGEKTCEDGEWTECACERAAVADGGACGDGRCAASETCETCPEDCGGCGTCGMLASCSGGFLPQAVGTMPARSGLDVRLEAKSKAQVLEELQTLAARHPEAFALVRAALAPPRPAGNESATVQGLRELFAQHPRASAAVARQIARPELADTVAGAEGPPRLSTRGGDTGPGGLGDGGLAGCEAPALVVRVGKITVHEEDDDVANDKVYCLLTAEAPAGGEQRISPRTPALDEGQSFSLGETAGKFWGQNGPRDPGGDLELDYNCYEEDNANGYASFVRAAGIYLARNGTRVDDSGYVSAAGVVVAAILPAVLALDTDDHLFTASQVVPRATQLELAAGASWSVKKKGTHYYSDWEWSLTVEAFGCAPNGTKTAP